MHTPTESKSIITRTAEQLKTEAIEIIRKNTRLDTGHKTYEELANLIPVGTEFYRVKGTELMIYIYHGIVSLDKGSPVHGHALFTLKGEDLPPFLEPYLVSRILRWETEPKGALYFSRTEAYRETLKERTEDVTLLTLHASISSYLEAVESVRELQLQGKDINGYVFSIDPLQVDNENLRGISSIVEKTLADLGLEIVYASKCVKSHNVEVYSLLPFRGEIPNGITYLRRETLSRQEYRR